MVVNSHNSFEASFLAVVFYARKSHEPVSGACRLKSQVSTYCTLYKIRSKFKVTTYTLNNLIGAKVYCIKVALISFLFYVNEIVISFRTAYIEKSTILLNDQLYVHWPHSSF